MLTGTVCSDMCSALDDLQDQLGQRGEKHYFFRVSVFWVLATKRRFVNVQASLAEARIRKWGGETCLEEIKCKEDDTIQMVKQTHSKQIDVDH